jgi:hypothetical protein
MPSGNSFYWIVIVALVVTFVAGGLIAFSVR